MTRYEQFKQHIQGDITGDMLKYLAHNIRPADTREANAACGFPHTPEVWERELALEVRGSAISRVFLENDLRTPLGIYGAVDVEYAPGLGCLWMHGTPALEKHRHSFLKLGRYGVEELQQRYRQLVAYADIRNALHTRWLKWMGFYPVGMAKMADPEVGFIIFVLPGGKELYNHV